MQSTGVEWVNNLPLCEVVCQCGEVVKAYDRNSTPHCWRCDIWYAPEVHHSGWYLLPTDPPVEE